MRLSKAFIPTLKEIPQDVVAKSHQLMLKAGMIRLHTTGVYSYLPFGWRVLQNIRRIIKEEMDRIGGQEFLLPSLSRMEIWKATGREDEIGDDMFKLKDRKGSELCLAPTHEEIFTEIAQKEIRSYRELPQIWYQIQTKFRDEPRPRSGVLRGRQFLMKDAYSFDVDEEGLEVSYRLQKEAYLRICRRCGLDVLTVSASSGIMGGSESEEFMVLSDSGEDEIALCESCGYASNMEVGRSVARVFDLESRPAEKVHTPGTKTIAQVCQFLKVDPHQLMKSLLFMADDRPVMALVRGDHNLSEAKLAEILDAEVHPSTEEEILEITGAPAGFIGPVGLKGVETIADPTLKDQKAIITGANQEDYHFRGLEAGRDFRANRYEDIRYIKTGEGCPECKEPIKVTPTTEVGHIFKLGVKYSKALEATFLDSKGRAKPIVMGSYGIGLERVMATVIDQDADEDGIVWPISIAPYQVHILPVNISHKETIDISEKLYCDLQSDGFDVLFDDRDERPGTKFKDADLLGIPVRLTIGERGLKEKIVEIRHRSTKEVEKVKTESIQKRVIEIIGSSICRK